MSKESLYKLYLEKQKTQFRDPISVKKQVGCTLYYLADEGRLCKAVKSLESSGIVWNAFATNFFIKQKQKK